MAVTQLFGTGGAPLFAIARGRHDQEAEARYLNTTACCLILSALGLTLLLEISQEPLLRLFGASDLTGPYAAAYLRLYLLGTPFTMLATGLNGFINAQGFGTVGMLTVVSGAVANLILDPLFI